MSVRRRVASCALALVAAACGGSPAPSPAGGPSPSIETTTMATAAAAAGSPDAASPIPTGGPSSPGATHETVELDPVFRAMVDAITSHRPGYRFRLTPDRLDGDWRLDGDVDDGSGAARLFIALTFKPGEVTAHPCADRDFTQGGACAEQRLSNGDLLALRGLVEAHGTRTVVVALIHPNRSGLTAEASNFRMEGLPGPLPGSDPPPPISRHDPPYTVIELAELIRAIDARLRACPTAICP
jgi:hypothetical protein